MIIIYVCIIVRFLCTGVGAAAAAAATANIDVFVAIIFTVWLAVATFCLCNCCDSTNAFLYWFLPIHTNAN